MKIRSYGTTFGAPKALSWPFRYRIGGEADALSWAKATFLFTSLSSARRIRSRRPLAGPALDRNRSSGRLPSVVAGKGTVDGLKASTSHEEQIKEARLLHRFDHIGVHIRGLQLAEKTLEFVVGVRITRRVDEIDGSDLIAFASAIPSISGICMSIRASWYGFPSAAAALSVSSAFVPVCCAALHHLPGKELMAKNLPACRIIVHNKSLHVHERACFSIDLRHGRTRHLVQPHAKPESRALADLARDADLAPHQFHELLRDGQPQTRAAKAPCRRTVRLGEGLEQLLPGCRSAIADAGVFDPKPGLRRLVSVCSSADTRTITSSFFP